MFNPIFNKKIGQIIVSSRRAQKINQASLARNLGFSAQFLGRIEKGAVSCPEIALKKVVKILSIPHGTLAVTASFSASAYCGYLLRNSK